MPNASFGNSATFIPPTNKVCEGYVFTPVCQSFCSQGGVVSQHALQVSRRGWYPSMTCRSPGPHPRGKLRGMTLGGLQAHTWEGVPGQTTPADGYCCGRYASYWNAFLFLIISLVVTYFLRAASRYRRNTRFHHGN